jgi:hypothetical protein
MIEKDSGGSQAPTSASVNAASSDTAKPKGMSIVEWVTKKPVVEEKQHWVSLHILSNLMERKTRHLNMEHALYWMFQHSSGRLADTRFVFANSRHP